jgi:hypothetical protein
VACDVGANADRGAGEECRLVRGLTGNGPAKLLREWGCAAGLKKLAKNMRSPLALAAQPVIIVVAGGKGGAKGPVGPGR